MNIDLKEHFYIVEEGTTYELPVYEVVEGKGIVELEKESQVLHFVRGSKINDVDVEKRVGTLHEHLMSVMIYDLKLKNKLVPSRETAIVITKLEEALHWLRHRQIDRLKREVEGTYNK
jgi:hypothetical protein